MLFSNSFHWDMKNSRLCQYIKVNRLILLSHVSPLLAHGIRAHHSGCKHTSQYTAKIVRLLVRGDFPEVRSFGLVYWFDNHSIQHNSSLKVFRASTSYIVNCWNATPSYSLTCSLCTVAWSSPRHAIAQRPFKYFQGNKIDVCYLTCR